MPDQDVVEPFSLDMLDKDGNAIANLGIAPYKETAALYIYSPGITEGRVVLAQFLSVKGADTAIQFLAKLAGSKIEGETADV